MLFSRFLSFALFLVLLFVGTGVCAQMPNQSATTSVVTEITADDFTKLHTIRSTSLAVFGVKLGDSLADTREKVQRAGLTWWPTHAVHMESVFSSPFLR